MPTGESLKQRIRKGDVIVALRVSIDIDRSQLETALAKGSYDLLYIDGQHTAFSDDKLVSFCAMGEALGLPVQFRIPHTRHTYLIGRYLDLGLAAILVPEVMPVGTPNVEAIVDEAIAYSYYPQVGRRSWGGIARYGLKSWGGPVDRLEYAAWWNDIVVLAIQLESVEAIINARRLAKPGVDYVAFGPNDLLFSLEGHPEFPLRSVNDCMRNVADQLKGSGIRLGMAITTLPEERDKFLEMGITIFQEAPRS
jgi:2-keto-3-deoxy-L-rhamnonate aldolase RhmA